MNLAPIEIVIYVNENIEKKKISKELGYFEKEEETEDPLAQTELGLKYDKGDGVEKNYKKK